MGWLTGWLTRWRVRREAKRALKTRRDASRLILDRLTERDVDDYRIGAHLARGGTPPTRHIIDHTDDYESRIRRERERRRRAHEEETYSIWPRINDDGGRG